MLVAEMAIAECAVADDALSCILALLEVATRFAGGHDVGFCSGGSRHGEEEDGWLVGWR